MSFKKLNPVAEFIAKQGLGIAEARVDALIPESEPNLQKIANIVFLGADRIVDVLSDDNFDNAAQIREVLLKTINVDVKQFLSDLATPLVGSIPAEDDQKVAALGAKIVLDLLGILTDSDTDNKDQLAAYFKAEIFSDEFLNVVAFSLVLHQFSKVLPKDIVTALNLILQVAIKAIKEKRQVTAAELSGLTITVAQN
jgi:hypothetical protein